jgi:quinol monooxygenase YgiN
MTEETSNTEPQGLATFEVKFRPDANVEEALALQEGLLELARNTPTIGEIEMHQGSREDGTLLVVYTFKSVQAMKEFIRHPEHVAVMRRGKEFFSSLGTQIATLEKQSHRSYDS